MKIYDKYIRYSSLILIIIFSITIASIILAISCCRSKSASGPYGQSITATACAKIQGNSPYDSSGLARMSWSTLCGYYFSRSEFSGPYHGTICFANNARISYSTDNTGSYVYSYSSASAEAARVSASVTAYLSGYCGG